MSTTNRRFLAAAALGSTYLWLGSPTPAHSGGFSTARFGGEHGHAAADHPTTIYYNPAGIALGKGTRVYVEGTFAYRTVDYDRDEGAIDNPGTATPDEAIDANAGSAHLSNFLVSPFVGVVTDAGVKGLGLGLALYAPFGGQADWDKSSVYGADDTQYPGAYDGTQRWAAISGHQRTIYVTMGGAWASPKKSVAFGAGMNLVLSDLALVRARNATGTDDLVNPNGTVAEGRSLLEGDDVTFSLGLGAMWSPSPKIRFGVGYQSMPGFGDMTLEGTLTNKFGSNPETATEVVLLQRMPDVLRVAAELGTSKELVVRLSADWQRWSKYANQCLIPAEETNQTCTFNESGGIDAGAGGSEQVIVNLPRNWKDTMSFKGGVGYHPTEKIEVSGSITYDTNAVPDETMDPSLFDMNKIILQLGGDLALSQTLYLSATLGQVVYFSRTTEPRAEDPVAPSRNPDMAGKYSQSVTYLLVGMGVNL
jgi:long-chain fatty acid transport protein